MVPSTERGAGPPRFESPVQEEYRRLAARYDERWTAYVRRTTERTLDHLRPNAGERILDVGCGTGALLRALEERQPKTRVVGVDLSLPMLRAARPRHEGAVLAVGEAGLLPLRSGSFDAVTSVSSFHYWADPEGRWARSRACSDPAAASY